MFGFNPSLEMDGGFNPTYKALFPPLPNLTDEDSIPMGTRWFDVLQGSGTIPSAVDDGIDEAAFGPRAVFRSFRKGSQLGVKVSRRF